MAGWRRPWQTAGHVSPRILEILIYSIWRKEVSLIALSKQEIRATGRYGPVDFIKIFILILLLSFYFPNLSLQNFVK